MSRRHRPASAWRSLRAPWHRASGLGYVVWFAALRGLTASRAATVQLSVPVIAAFGGIVLLAEDVSLRLLIASIATLGGIWIVLAQRDRNADVR
jgi:drug/metabolite transporter (DMT)-like permease